MIPKNKVQLKQLKPEHPLIKQKEETVTQNQSIAELELLANVRGLEKICFYLNGKVVDMYSNHKVLEPLIKCNPAYPQKGT